MLYHIPHVINDDFAHTSYLIAYGEIGVGYIFVSMRIPCHFATNGLSADVVFIHARRVDNITHRIGEQIRHGF